MARIILRTLWLLAVTAELAWAHGGQYQRPPQPKNGRTNTAPRGGGITPGTTPTWRNWWARNREEFFDVRKRRMAKSENAYDDGQVDQKPFHQTATRDDIRNVILPVLVHATRDGTADVRDAAAIAVGRAGSAPEVEVLAPLLEDASSSVREGAIIGLGLLRHPMAEARLVRVLTDPGTDAKERGLAAIALGLSGGDRARLALLDRFGSESPVKNASRAKIRQLEGARALGLGLTGDRAAVAAIVDAFEKSRIRDRNFRPMCLTALARARATTAATLVFKGLAGRDKDERRAAAILAGRTLRREQDSAIKRLISAIRAERDLHAKYFGLISLGRIGGDRALGALRTSLSRASNREERAFAALALGIAKDLDSADRLRTVVAKMKDVSLRGAAAIALAIMSDRKAAQVIRAELNATRNPELRASFVTALAMLDDTAALEDIRSIALDARNQELVNACGLALSLMQDQSSLEVLLRILRQSGSIQVKGGMATAIGRIGDRRTIEPLIGIVSDERATDLTRAFAVVALGLIGDKSVTSEITRVSIDSNYPMTTCDALTAILDVF